MSFFLTTLTFIVCSCSGAKAAYLEAEGEARLAQGRYGEARDSLEQSIQLYPYSANAHADLACAYFELGDEKNCWLYLRKACILDRKNSKCAAYLKGCWDVYKKSYGIQKGTSREEIIHHFGDPDYIVADGNCLIYGTIFIYLKNDKFDRDELIKP